MNKLIFLFAGALVMSCQSTTKSENGTTVIKNPDGSETIVTQTETTTADVDENQNSEPVAHPLIDNKGQVMAHMTFPANWKLHNEPGKAAYSGPGGIFVFHTAFRNFTYSNDQMMRNIYAQNNVKMRQYIPAREVINQDFLPIAKKEGSKLIRVTDAPQIAKQDQSMMGMMYTIGPRNYKYDAVVSEWEDKNGKPYVIVVHTNASEMMGTVNWSYNGQILDAPKEKYEYAKKTLVDGLASLQYNPRYFDKYNQSEMNKEGQSWAAHNQKMSNQQRNFDAQQSAYKSKTEAINSSIMASYNARNAASDRSHNRFVNYIKDQNTVVNPHDGKNYQVQTGSDQYWMNENGQYIGTNDPNYDPNRNQGTQNQTWNEAPTTD